MTKKNALLSPIAFQIVLALSLKPRHGYEIMKQVEDDSQGRIKIGPGSLYGTINILVEAKLVRERQQAEDTRRKYYELTDNGWNTLNRELSHLENTLKVGQQRLGLDNKFVGAPA